jgi:hypothetical protein
MSVADQLDQLHAADSKQDWQAIALIVDAGQGMYK